MTAGTIVLEPGRRLGSREIAACAAAGAGEVRVRRRIRVGLLATGDEVLRPGAALQGAEIWDVNTPMLAAAMASPAVDIVCTEHGSDSRAGLQRQIAAMAESVDLIVTTGGVSVGDEDHVKPSIAALGGRLHFSGVAIKPGKPVSFGRIGAANWLGLPGNPLSAFVTWHLFGTALLAALIGRTDAMPLRRHVLTDRPLRHKPGRCELRLARITGTDGQGREVVTFEDATHSDRVGNLPDAHGLILLPAALDGLPDRALVQFQPFGEH